MFKKFTRIAFAAALLAATQGAWAASTYSAATASWAVITEQPDGDFLVTYKKGTYDLDVSPDQNLVNGMWFYNWNVQDQSAPNIQTVIANKYGIQPASALKFVSGCNAGKYCAASSSNPYMSASSALTGTSTFHTSGAFDYLAVHVGQAEMIFHWSQPITSFAITAENSTSWSSSVSNYRAYLGPQIVAAPLPAAGWLFLTALGAMGIFKRRRKNIA